MSRIFDALRRSEEDRQPGDKNWPPLPAALTDAHGPIDAAELQESETPLEKRTPEVFSADQSAPPAEADDRFAHLVRTARESSGMPQFALPRDFEPGSAAAAEPELSIDLSKLKAAPVSSVPSPRLVALSSERGLGAEKFRVLGVRLSNLRLSTPLGILQVTSSVTGEGKTLTSVNLAMTLATRFAQKVLLAEGDLRKPAVCKLLGMPDQPGIGEWWEHPETPVSEFLLRIGETGMCLLPAGEVAHPASVLQSSRIAELFAGLARKFDWIIIDTPPLLPMADSNLWSRLSDGTLLVVRKGTVSRSALKKAVESLDNPKLVGIVLNDSSDFDKVNYYDRHYNQGGGETGKAASQ